MELKEKIATGWWTTRKEKNGKIFEKFSPQERYRQKSRSQAMEKLGGKCEECGYGDVESLMIVSKDGSRRGWCDVNPAIVKGSDNYRLLCRNCEWKSKKKNVGRGRKER